jgi:hypothetical protein
MAIFKQPENLLKGMSRTWLMDKESCLSNNTALTASEKRENFFDLIDRLNIIFNFFQSFFYNEV